MKLDAKVAELTKEVASGNASKEKKQLLLWLLELQVSRELEEPSLDEGSKTVLYSVEMLEDIDSYIENANCTLNDFFNIFKMISTDVAQSLRDRGIAKEDAQAVLEGIMLSALKESYESRQVH